MSVAAIRALHAIPAALEESAQHGLVKLLAEDHAGGAIRIGSPDTV
eukprot:CAMPEP_0179153042 /NCGR_PEP_ID=MMETSP0796-20121207/74400_1 /TAXON_ID=73915 /ORGANISM="Pyrodinium bahamense, Strain pbaha01" /LENGTH=45 /DNA_ID= /DNA_START= /DNA_END= /DNA_ORIENTATION=